MSVCKRTSPPCAAAFFFLRVSDGFLPLSHAFVWCAIFFAVGMMACAPAATAFHDRKKVQRPYTMPVVTTGMKQQAGPASSQSVSARNSGGKASAEIRAKKKTAKNSPPPRYKPASTAARTVPSYPLKEKGVSARGMRSAVVTAVPQKATVKAAPVSAGKTSGKGRKSAAGLQSFAGEPLSREKEKACPQKTFSLRKPSEKEDEREGKRLAISSKTNGPPENRLVPHRGRFSGGSHTLPYMDKANAAEVSMEYKLSPRAATRVVINPQDEASPLYRPAESEKRINSGGVYMDVEMAENLQLKMGGEYSEVESAERIYGSDKSSQGAAVGLQWTF